MPIRKIYISLSYHTQIIDFIHSSRSHYGINREQVERVDNGHFDDEYRYNQWLRATSRHTVELDHSKLPTTNTVGSLPTPQLKQPYDQNNSLPDNNNNTDNSNTDNNDNKDNQLKKDNTKGTVGAVALDIYGNLAAATSTGR